MGGLRVAEVFRSWQGEGPANGQRANFLRLGLCNLHCSWCDTPYTWDRTRFDLNDTCPETPPAHVIDALDIDDDTTDLLILTGGEPLIWQEHPDLWTILDTWPAHVHVETAGTLTPSPRLAQRLTGASVSVKLFDQGDPRPRRIVPDVVTAWAGLDYAVLKIVCRTPFDVRDAARFADHYGFTGRLWIQPEGTDPLTLIVRARELVEVAGEVGAHLSLRTHILLFGDTRGT